MDFVDTIINDSTGLVIHIPAYMTETEAHDLFCTLRESPKWEQPVVKLYGATFKPHRGIYAMADDNAAPYRFSGDSVVPHPWSEDHDLKAHGPGRDVYDLGLRLTRDIRTSGIMAEWLPPTPPNFVLLNHYYDGTSHLGYHADDERDMKANAPIVGVSLGQPRDFLIRAESPQAVELHGKKPIKIRLDPGDVLIMAGNTQKHYKHSVPTRKRMGERISLTYRYMKKNSSTL